MARKPVNEVHLLATREALWAAIRQLDGWFSARQLRDETCCTTSQTREYLTGLTAAGILEKDSATRGVRYTLVRDCGAEAPRVRRDGSTVTQGRGREQIWETMRALGDFTPLDLHALGSTDDHVVALSEAETYCRYLCLAGYLARLAKDRYRLIKRTGPKPPMIQRVRRVYDPNLKQVMWSEGGGDDNE